MTSEPIAMAANPVITTSSPTLLTAQEIVNHPEYPHVIWDLKPEKRATIEVAKDRSGPVKLAYEIHGSGPIKMVVSYYTAYVPCRLVPRYAFFS